tara:strand:+ start:590 stop:1291 length:702 start_codon:yes stop_codon:yes gene_type:complete
VLNINKIRKLSIWVFFLPMVVLNLCLFISVNYDLLENTIFIVDQIGRTAFTIPYIDGGVSISRTARTYPAYLIFKPGMIVTAIFLIQYWKNNNSLFKNIVSDGNKNLRFYYLGIISAFFLIAHSIFLGIHFDNDFYKLFRRFVLLGFIIFELAAQTLLVIILFNSKHLIAKHINNNILTLKIILISMLVLVAFISLPFLVTSGHVHFKHALEWDYFVALTMFYLLSYLFWKKQ